MDSNSSHLAARAALRRANTVVVKVGTRVLSNESGRIDRKRLKQIVEGVAELWSQGKAVVLVTSGAVGAGIEALGWKSRPTNVPDLQMSAAVGQSRLMAEYAGLFSKKKITIGQILLTHDGLHERRRHLNIRNTISNLLRHRIVPIANENDVVSVDEIKIGDNDFLASLVAMLVDADALVLLTTVDGLRDSVGKRSKRIAHLPELTKSKLALASGKGSFLSTGGMATKLQAAQQFVSSGGLTVIADGRKAGQVKRIFEGVDTGTLIGTVGDKGARIKTHRKRWLAFFKRSAGVIVVDSGACAALVNSGKSLLPIGVKKVKGSFENGALVNIESAEGDLIARGLVEYSSAEIDKIKGCRTSEIKKILGEKPYDEVIHRDNLVLLSEIS